MLSIGQTLQLGPSLRSLSRRKLTLFLIVIQLAIAASIMSNVSYIIGALRAHISHPTDLDHERLFSIMLRPADGRGISYQRVETELQRLRELPGVASAAAVRWAPLGFLAQAMPVALQPGGDVAKTTLQSAQVSPDALTTLQLELIAGRDFTPGDMAEAGQQPNSAIISKTAAEALFGDIYQAIGQRLYTGDGSFEVIGVTRDWAGFTRPPFGRRELTLFLPMYDESSSEWRYLVRSREQTVSPDLVDSTTQLLTDLYQNRVLIDVELISKLLAQGFAEDNVFCNLFIVFLVFLAFVIALAIGGQTLFWVSQQQRNLGIRRALGATRAQILSLVLSQNVLMALPGLLFGLVLSLWFAGLIQAIAPQVPPMPPHYLTGTGIVLLALVLASASVPAWRASRVAPSVATRRT